MTKKDKEPPEWFDSYGDFQGRRWDQVTGNAWAGGVIFVALIVCLVLVVVLRYYPAVWSYTMSFFGAAP